MTTNSKATFRHDINIVDWDIQSVGRVGSGQVGSGRVGSCQQSKVADGMANSVDPGQSLIWVYTVCPDLSVPILVGSLHDSVCFQYPSSLTF